jgi:hypothetical protein
VRLNILKNRLQVPGTVQQINRHGHRRFWFNRRHTFRAAGSQPVSLACRWWAGHLLRRGGPLPECTAVPHNITYIPGLRNTGLAIHIGDTSANRRDHPSLQLSPTFTAQPPCRPPKPNALLPPAGRPLRFRVATLSTRSPRSMGLQPNS